jgi:hypothetical protein
MLLTSRLAENNERILSGLRAGKYDFLDLGTHDGGGFKIGEHLGGQHGVGFEVEPLMAERNLDRGRDVMCLDVRMLPPGITGVRFGVCSHVLEHLPNLYDVGSVIAALTPLCSDFLLICGPNFDSENFLYSHNLKLVHSAMRDHLCKFRTIDLVRVLFDLDLRDFVIGVSGVISGSASPWVHRSDAPAEGLWMWTEEKNLPKPMINFDRPLYRDIVSVVKLREEVNISRIMRDFYWGCDKTIFQSTNRFRD